MNRAAGAPPRRPARPPGEKSRRVFIGPKNNYRFRIFVLTPAAEAVGCGHDKANLHVNTQTGWRWASRLVNWMQQRRQPTKPRPNKAGVVFFCPNSPASAPRPRPGSAHRLSRPRPVESPTSKKSRTGRGSGTPGEGETNGPGYKALTQCPQSPQLRNQNQRLEGDGPLMTAYRQPWVLHKRPGLGSEPLTQAKSRNNSKKGDQR